MKKKRKKFVQISAILIKNIISKSEYIIKWLELNPEDKM